MNPRRKSSPLPLAGRGSGGGGPGAKTVSTDSAADAGARRDAEYSRSSPACGGRQEVGAAEAQRASPPHKEEGNLGLRSKLLPALLVAAGLALVAHGAFIPAKAALAQALLERAWSRTLDGEVQARPWAWADTWPVAVVEAPRLGARAVVLAEAGGEAMAFGPMKLTQTPAPGAPGVAVIAAHRDTHFRFLKDVRPGDLITVATADGAVRAFRAAGGEVVRHDRSGIEPSVGPARLALVTCWPFDAQTPGPLRYVLWADLVEEA